MKKVLTWLFIGSWATFSIAQGSSELLTGFKKPPIEARPIALWDWTKGNFSLSQITHELEEAKAKGMGGFDIWDVGLLVDPPNGVPAGPAFMSPQSVQGIAHAVREADRLGLNLGLITSSSWNAGGTWVAPEHGTMGLFQSKVEVKGGQIFKGKIPFPQLPEKYGSLPALIEKTPAGLPTFYLEVGLLAIPKGVKTTTPKTTIDLSTLLQKDGTITWKAPKGDWELIRYVCAPTGQPLVVPSPNSLGRMIDHFSAEATEAHLLYILKKLEAELGSLRNRSLKYLYVDSYEVQEGIWTPKIASEFKKRWGYDLVPYLPVFSGKIIENEATTQRFLYEYKKLLSDLIIENHYRKGVEVCKRYGLGYVAEAGGPGPPVHNVPYEDLKALGSLTYPRGEFWNNHPKGETHNAELQIVKGISSSAHLYNQKYVEAEAFTSVWVWQEGPQVLKPLADRAFCEGLNRIVYHTFPHTPPEDGNPGWVYNFGTLVHLNNAWWPKSGAFHQYLARCSYLLQQGNFVGDVAFYYGDQAPNFVTQKQVHPSLGPGYDYDVVNSEAILEKMSVRDGKITLPHGQTYEILVLPNDLRVNLAVLQKIEGLVKAGATVVGRKPNRGFGLKNQAEEEKMINTLANQLWGACDSLSVQENKYGLGKIVWGKTLRKVLMDKGIGPDFEAKDSSNVAFDFIHRQTENADIYFVRNTRKTAGKATLYFRSKKGTPQIWSAIDGQAYALKNAKSEANGSSFPLELEPQESFFVVFQGQNVPAQVSDNQALFKKSQTLDGPWELRFPFGWGAPDRVILPQLQSWSTYADTTIQHFSGVATYHKSFEWSGASAQRQYLNLGQVHEIADVWLNGHHLGERCFPPFRYEITSFLRPGTNYLVVEVANALNNRMVGDAKLPPAYRRTKSNITKAPNAWMQPWAQVNLLESGLCSEVWIEEQ
jgi:hypothetical protein